MVESVKYIDMRYVIFNISEKKEFYSSSSYLPKLTSIDSGAFVVNLKQNQPIYTVSHSPINL